MTDKQQSEALRLADQLSGAKLNYSVLYVYASQHGIDYNSLCVAVQEASAQPAAQQGVAGAALPDVDALAQEIRRVDGANKLGAGALAEALMPFLRASHGQAPAGATIYVCARNCSNCDHTGINDDHTDNAACNACGWSGPSPEKDHCPGCGQDGTMTAACPKCSGVYRPLAETTITAQADSVQEDAAR